MRVLLSTIAATALLAGCGQSTSKTETSKLEAPKSEAKASVAAYDINRQYEKFAEVPMNPDVSFLTPTERKVVNKLIEASGYLSQIYLLQRGADYAQRRAELETSGTAIEKAMFDLHFGPCDTLEDDSHVFVGDTPCPAGAGFYPAV